MRDKHLELVQDRDNLPAVLVGDDTRLAQALLNCLANAVKFTKQGKITLRLAKVEETAGDLLVRFEVTDTGIGIAPEKIKELFAAFERADTSTARHYGGSGLGLDAARGIKVLNGHLAAYLRLLHHYASDHANDMERLRQRMSAGDQKEARWLAHTLKGSSGNLGATVVQDLAAGLEAAIKEGQDAAEIEVLASTVERELQRLIAAIRSALPEEAAALYESAVDWAMVRQVLAELEPLLAASNVQANQFIETHAALLKAALGPVGAELKRQIADFRYPEALQAIRQARAEHAELDGSRD